jgi:DNA-binding transcriptional ArsR family regulator
MRLPRGRNRSERTPAERHERCSFGIAYTSVLKLPGLSQLLALHVQQTLRKSRCAFRVTSMANDPIRQVTDSRVLAAMSHPLRRRLLDVLKVHGPATVSALAGRTDQSVANVSHHLRVLHSSGLIEEAPELARDRRERWWRLVSAALRWSSVDFAEDPASEAIAEAGQSLNLDHHSGLVRTWFAADEDQRTRWDDAAFSTDKWLTLTPAELAELSHQVIDLLDRWATRKTPDDGQQREPVFVFTYGVPVQP